MISHRRPIGGVALYASALCVALFVVDSARAATTRIAFIDFDKSAVGGALDARLLTKAKYQWVERTNIDQVVNEQRTQSLFSAAGVADRSSLGRTLRADVLVMLRSATGRADSSVKEASPAGAAQLHLIICETRRGLRLAVHSAAVEPDKQAALVDRLEQWIDAALLRVDRPIVDICAVPPFVSNDLSFAFDHLKRVYANLVEQTVFQHGGFAVVELAEAEALAKELVLVGQSDPLDRRLPLYLLGEYRHEGETKSPHVRLKLRLMRGTELVAADESGDLTPNDVPVYLQNSTGALLRKVSADNGAVYNAKVEARQLADRAREFMDLGNFEEAMPLLDASLLLRSDDHDVRRDAVVSGGKMAQWYFYHRDDVQVALPAIRTFRRGMEHLEIWLSAHPEAPQSTSGNAGRTFVNEFNFTSFFGNLPQNPEIRAAHDEINREIRETLLRLVRMRSRQNASDAGYFLNQAVSHLPSRERFQIIGQVALELQDLPDAGRRTTQFATGWYTIQMLEKEGGAELLADLAKARNPDVRATAERLKAQLESARKTPMFPETTVDDTFEGEPKLSIGSMNIAFTPVTWSTPNDSRSLRYIGGCLRAGPGTDVLWSNRTLYVMKQPGVLRKVWEGSELNDRFHTISDNGLFSGSYVSYDGRYVWATVSRLRAAPLLLVLDPIAETVVEISADDGLPLAASSELAKDGNYQFMAVSALEPGRACVAGSFGRSWIAMVTFDPAGKHKVKIIHECRRIADPLNEDHWRSTDVAFDPTFVFTLSDVKTGAKRVLMGRGNRNHHFNYHPLLIDPAQEKVAVLADKLPHFQSSERLFLHEGTLYFVDYAYAEGRDVRISRIGAPAWKLETLLHHVPQGLPAVMDGQLHIVGKRWWSGSLPAGPMSITAAKVPWHYTNGWAYPGQTRNPEFNLKMPPGQSRIEGIWQSNHYGLLVRTRRLDQSGHEILQATLDSRQKSKIP